MAKIQLKDIKINQTVIYNDGSEKVRLKVKKINLPRREILVTFGRNKETYLFPSDFTAGHVYSLPAREKKSAAKTTGKKHLIEYAVSYNGGFYLTTDAELKGRGIRKSGDGKDHKRGKKTYHATEIAFKKIKKEFPTEYKPQ